MRVSIYAPPYYSAFKCLAGECKHTCCAGWRIGLDEETLALYNALDGELGEVVRANIDTDEDGAHIPLDGCGRCPHLDSDGLCRIISAMGQGAVSEICREHPRFYNLLPDRIEVGLGLSCEAAALSVLSSDEYLPTLKVGEGDTDSVGGCLAERNEMLSLLADSGLSYREKLTRLTDKYDIGTNVSYCEKWQKILGSLEFKDDNNARIILTEPHSHKGVCEVYLERFLAYMIYRHVTCAESELDMRARLGFALISVAVFENMAASTGAKSPLEYAELARIYSEEIEYSESNTDTLIFEIECEIL